MTLLDVGCGWGSTMMRAIEKYDVNVIGLTLSENQKAHVETVFAASDSPRTKRILLQGWEQFDEPVDRIVSIGAFEHFGFDRYTDFFAMAYRALPDDGVMLLHTITALTLPQMTERGMPLTFDVARFVKFILTEIFPGGRLPSIEKVEEYALPAGFKLTRTQSLQAHYARTLDTWAAALEANKDQAIAIQSRRGLRPVHAVPHGLREGLPDRLHRRPPVHPGQVEIPGGNRPPRRVCPEQASRSAPLQSPEVSARQAPHGRRACSWPSSLLTSRTCSRITTCRTTSIGCSSTRRRPTAARTSSATT